MNDVLMIVVLLGGGMLLILAEVCTPSFGVLAISSIACFVAAVYKCFTISPVLGFAAAVACVVGLPFYIWAMMKVFPYTPIGRRLMLRPIDSDAGGGAPSSREEKNLIGAEGTTTSTLRPTGTIVIDGKRLYASAERGYLPADTPVRVVRSTGLTLIVRAIEAEPDELRESS